MKTRTQEKCSFGGKEGKNKLLLGNSLKTSKRNRNNNIIQVTKTTTTSLTVNKSHYGIVKWASKVTRACL